MTKKPFLHPLFSENAVLQRDRALTIWGWTAPDTDVSVKFDGAAQTVRAEADGRWSAPIAPHAAGGPHILEVTGAVPDENAKCENLLFGDVWLCSGQSNMEWPVKESANAAAEKAAANYPQIRLMRVPRLIENAPLEFAEGAAWQNCSPATVGDFSAVGYFFGRKLQEELGVPFGLIDSSWGGTPAEAWVSDSALQTLGDFDGAIAQMKSNTLSELSQNTPTALYNGMISPLLPGQIKGAIWYQGESNADRSAQYQKLLPALIKDWRARFGEPLPFYIVQLANYMAPDELPSDDAWPLLRESQAMTARDVADVGLAIITDVGEEKDIHPRNKQDVGLRLALAALHQTYGQNLEYSGPVLEKSEATGNALQLTFSHAEGLNLKGDENRVFAIAGADKKFYWATPVIVGNAITLSCPDVATPTDARFGWSNNPRAALYNSAGLPAAPFRTD